MKEEEIILDSVTIKLEDHLYARDDPDVDFESSGINGMMIGVLEEGDSESVQVKSEPNWMDHDAQIWSCDSCNRDFPNYVALATHISTNSCNMTESYVQDDTSCRVNLKKEGDQIKRESQLQNPEPVNVPLKRIRGPECSNTRCAHTDESSLHKHKISDDIDDEDESPDGNQLVLFRCGECKRLMKTAEDESIDKLNHSQDEDLRSPVIYSCGVCSKNFRSHFAFEAHEIEHKKGKGLQRSYTCHFCGTAFYIKFQFDRHIQSHTQKPVTEAFGEVRRPLLKSPFNMTSFPSQSQGNPAAPKNHTQEHLPSTTVKPNKARPTLSYKCHICVGYRFYANKRSLTDHVEMFHAKLLKPFHDEESNNSQIYYKCYRCQKRFGFCRNLRSHLVNMEVECQAFGKRNKK